MKVVQIDPKLFGEEFEVCLFLIKDFFSLNPILAIFWPNEKKCYFSVQSFFSILRVSGFSDVK